MSKKSRRKSMLQRASGWFARRAAGVAKRAAKYAGIPLRDPALVAMFGSNPASSGIDVDEDTALNCSTVFCATSLLSSTVATLPVHVCETRGDLVHRVPDDPAHYILAHEPNPELTPFVFHETLQAHVLNWGNAYAHIERDSDRPDGVPVALWPLMPNQVDVDRRPETGEVFYKFRGMYPGEQDDEFTAHEILHVTGLGFDGLKGYSVIARAREAIGLALATERTGAALFGRGARPGGILKHPGSLSEPAKKNLRETWEAMHRGPDNAHRLAVLDEGMEWVTTDLPLEDAQFLQTRAFQVTEIARWYRVPPHMLYELSNATLANIEDQGIEFLTYSLTPWLQRWTQEYNRKLFPRAQRGKRYVQHDPSILLHTNLKTRYEAYAIGRNGGWLTLNDILKREGENPAAGSEGEARLMPSTMVVMGPHLMPDHPKNPINKPEPQPDETVQDTAMNGAQVASLLTIVQAVAAGQLDPDSAVAMMQAAFPAVATSKLESMVKPYRNQKKEPVNGTPPVAPPVPDGGGA